MKASYPEEIWGHRTNFLAILFKFPAADIVKKLSNHQHSFKE
jgi:hypothetical protein